VDHLMTYDEVCIEIIALGGTETETNVAGTRAFIMPTPCLHLVALPDADGGGVLAQAWSLDVFGERTLAATFACVAREQVAPALPALTAQAQNITGEAP
jgi:hypothetical protein